MQEGGGLKEDQELGCEMGTDIYTLLRIKQITIEKVLYSTENSTQSSMVTKWGDTYIYVERADSLCCTAEINTTL